jgi:hypothetical protein
MISIEARLEEDASVVIEVVVAVEKAFVVVVMGFNEATLGRALDLK